MITTPTTGAEKEKLSTLTPRLTQTTTSISNPFTPELTVNHTQDGFEEFDNNYDYIASLPTASFSEFQFRDLLERAGSWELPEAYKAIVRIEDPETGRIIERAYKSQRRADKFVNKSQSVGRTVTAYSSDTLFYSPGFESLGLENN